MSLQAHDYMWSLGGARIPRTLTGDVGVQEWRLEKWTKPRGGHVIGEANVLAAMPDDTLRSIDSTKFTCLATKQQAAPPGHHSAGTDISVNGRRMLTGN